MLTPLNLNKRHVEHFLVCQVLRPRLILKKTVLFGVCLRNLDILGGPRTSNTGILGGWDGSGTLQKAGCVSSFLKKHKPPRRG